MAVTSKPEISDETDVVLALSDAPDNDAAIREIDTWAREHDFVRSNEYHLNARQTADGRRLYTCACYRLTDENLRAAQAELSRIRRRREQMAETVSSDRILREAE
jgi:hypothetical protein